MCLSRERNKDEKELMEIAKEVRAREAERRMEEAEIQRRNWYRLIYYYNYNPQLIKNSVLFKIIMHAAPLDFMKKLIETVLEGYTPMLIRKSAAKFIIDIMDYKMVKLAHAPGNQDLVKFMREAGMWMLGARDGTLFKSCGECLVILLVKVCLRFELGWDGFSARLKEGFEKENLKELDEVLVSLVTGAETVAEYFITDFLEPALPDATQTTKIMVNYLKSGDCVWPFAFLAIFEGDDKTLAVFLEAAATTAYFDKPHSTFDRTNVALRVKKCILMAREPLGRG